MYRFECGQVRAEASDSDHLAGMICSLALNQISAQNLIDTYAPESDHWIIAVAVEQVAWDYVFQWYWEIREHVEFDRKLT